MAQRTIVQLIDDLDGGDATETVTFALDGVTYEIDLNDDNAEQLRTDLARWVSAGRRAGRTVGAPAARRRSSAAKRDDLDRVRAWAREHGHQVSERGRVAAAVLEAYDAANA